MMTNEAIISEFLRTAYDDEKLAALLAHAEDGKLSHFSCCCLAGIPSANHALRGRYLDRRYAATTWEHGAYHPATPEKIAVSMAFNNLASGVYETEERDATRRAKLIPLIHAEMERREQERLPLQPATIAAQHC